MKRTFAIAFTMIVLCCLSLSAVVSAYKEGYSNTNYNTTTAPTMDGKYTTAGEWNGGMAPPTLPAGLYWKQMWTYPDNILQHFIAEALTDNTNDTGDYFQLCYDRNANGGTAPQADDIMIEYKGHSLSGLSVYVGNGTGWTKFTGWVYGTDLSIAESLSASAQNSNPHWIIELTFDKSKSYFEISGSGYQPWIRLAVYDASNAAAGVRDWPPASANVPNNWGLEIGTMDAIPEPLTIVAVVLLSFVAVVSSFYFLRKRSRKEVHYAGRAERSNYTL